jgi:FkbM family methyltransferase
MRRGRTASVLKACGAWPPGSSWTMSNQDLMKRLEGSVSFLGAPRLIKLKTAPIRLAFSKLLETLSLVSRRPIKIKARTFWNGDMLVVIPEVVSLSIQRYGFHEADLSRMVLTYLKPGMTFLDIGSHFGYFALLGSLLVGDEGQVHAFEPSPSAFMILRANASNKKNIVINNCAVHSRSGVVSINDYGIRYCAFNSMYGARLPQAVLSRLKVSRFDIRSVSVDEYVEKMGLAPDFIKIDAENAENEILSGMNTTIARFQPIIALEIGDIGASPTSTSQGLIDRLVNKNYKPYEIRDGKLVPHETAGQTPYAYGNLLFLSA